MPKWYKNSSSLNCNVIMKLSTSGSRDIKNIPLLISLGTKKYSYQTLLATLVVAWYKYFLALVRLVVEYFLYHSTRRLIILQYYTLAWSSFELFLDAKIQIQIVMQKRRPFMRHFQSIFKHCVVESANDSIAKYHYALGKVKI